MTGSAEVPGVKFENLIHFANSRWRHSQPKNSAQQLSSAALRQGWRVFQCAPESATPGICCQRRNLRLLHPLGPVDPQAIQQSLADWEVHPANTLIMTSYASSSAARLLSHFARQGYFCVHRQVDAFVEDPQLGSYSQSALEEICGQCQLITVSHPELRASLPSHHCPVVDLRNGLDRRLFAGPGAGGDLPADLRRGELTLAGPAINTKRVRTQVLVENGGTVVIGGIFQQEDRTDVNKVPVLGDVPVLGNLFKNTVRSSNKTELLVFITPKVVTEKTAAR